MKNFNLFILSCVVMLLSSCSESNFLGDNEAGLQELTESYENLEVSSKVDEGGGEGPKVETLADEVTIQESIDSSLAEILNNRSAAKQKLTRSVAGFENVVGVFKVGTCGSYRELEVKMDCEDHKSISRVNGQVGDSYVDGSGNVSFHFCLTEAARYYYGGVLLLDNKGYSDIILLRHHDTEDSSSSNYYKVNNGSNQTDFSGNYTKLAQNDIILGWGFQLSNTHWGVGEGPVNLSRYGTLTSNSKSTGSILVDDEDSKNQNWIKQDYNGTLQDVAGNPESFGIIAGGNTEYFVYARWP